MSASVVKRPALRFRRLGVKAGRWYVYSTLDLGRFYVNVDFGWTSGYWIGNFYVGSRFVSTEEAA